MANPLTQGKPTLWIDQYGDKLWARSLKELKGQVGRGAVHKVYVDKRDGRTVHTGYAIGRSWFTAYQPCEVAAS